MFDGGEKKKNQLVKANETTTTIIGQGVFIEGRTFKGVGHIRIDGVYMGEMFVDGSVAIGQTGEIRGNVTANSLVISGTITGNVVCREELHVTETAVTEGDIQTDKILVDHGAVINGTISTGRKTLVEPINLDEAVRNMNEGRKSLEMMDDRSDVVSVSRRRVDDDDRFGFFAK